MERPAQPGASQVARRDAGLLRRSHREGLAESGGEGCGGSAHGLQHVHRTRRMGRHPSDRWTTPSEVHLGRRRWSCRRTGKSSWMPISRAGRTCQGGFRPSRCAGVRGDARRVAPVEHARVWRGRRVVLAFAKVPGIPRRIEHANSRLNMRTQPAHPSHCVPIRGGCRHLAPVERHARAAASHARPPRARRHRSAARAMTAGRLGG